jgi:hypothetical protein
MPPTHLVLLECPVLRNERGKVLVHAPLVQPLFKRFLNGRGQPVKPRASVQSTTCTVRFCSQLRTELRFGVKRDVVYKKGPMLTRQVDVERTLGIVLSPATTSDNKDVRQGDQTMHLDDRKRHANGIRSRVIMFTTPLALSLILGFVVHVLDVGGREHDTDAGGWTSPCVYHQGDENQYPRFVAKLADEGDSVAALDVLDL